jgi:hypothetical protein
MQTSMASPTIEYAIPRDSEDRVGHGKGKGSSGYLVFPYQMIPYHHRVCVLAPQYIWSTSGCLDGADMSKRGKVIASTMDEIPSEWNNGQEISRDKLTNDNPWSSNVSTAAPSFYQRDSLATIPNTVPPAVPRGSMPAHISRPLEPTPLVQTLPVAESFCPSGFDMLEILVLLPTTKHLRTTF